MTFINCEIVTQEIEKITKDEVFQSVVRNIKAGKFVRDRNGKDYNDRIVYTKALREFLYNPAVLNVIFADLKLKAKFFKAFDYKGDTDFTIYPKCWLRDLPLLEIGKGSIWEIILCSELIWLLLIRKF